MILSSMKCLEFVLIRITQTQTTRLVLTTISPLSRNQRTISPLVTTSPTTKATIHTGETFSIIFVPRTSASSQKISTTVTFLRFMVRHSIFSELRGLRTRKTLTEKPFSKYRTTMPTRPQMGKFSITSPCLPTILL